MSLLAVLIICAAILVAAYATYGRLLSRLLRLDDSRVTPAVELRDDMDYQPIEPKFLMGQHFSAIAAAGPIVGPIAAGLMFGWLPALLWIMVGSIFIGGVHDFTTLVASVRHKARSIAEIVREHMSARSYLLFLLFVYIALIYIIVAFTDIVAASFVGTRVLDDGGTVSGGGIATSSLLYLALPLIMGCLLRFTRLSLVWATVIFLPLVIGAIAMGQKYPLDLAVMLGVEPHAAARLWGVLLLVYCFMASLAPMWLLLQPRGHLGGFFLYAALLAGGIGALIGGKSIEYPAFIGWTSSAGDPLAPMLFITIACGACSGFHCMIASGTTSKQLRRESDARPIGYGTMLLEGMVAVIALSCVMILAPDQAQGKQPGLIYAEGLGRFIEIIGVPLAAGICFGLLAFTTFVYDTLDVCTRLGRFIFQELTGWRGAAGRVVGTALTAVIPMAFLFNTPVDEHGVAQPAWRVYWNVFGASNQLLAALALICAMVWLWRTYRAVWVWLVMALPAAFMYVMSIWALLRFVPAGFVDSKSGDFIVTTNPVPWVALILVGLAAVLLIEAIMVLWPPRRPAAP
jgi:carbon starvation protein